MDDDSGGEVLHGDEDDSDERSESSDEEDEELTFDEIVQRVHQNDPDTTELCGYVHEESVQNMTDEEWERLGQDIVNNSHLKTLRLPHGALNEHKMSFFFRGLTRSSAIKTMEFYGNGFSVAGIRSMVPFLQNANKLTTLDVSGNNIQSQGFHLLLRTLRDGPIEHLSCCSCGIESIEIDRNNLPLNLKTLYLDGNFINADGCRELAKLLQGEDYALKSLWLKNNKIDDEGVEIIVDALRNNTSLTYIGFSGNVDISKQGQIMLLKLLNDISSIKATLQSNHTLIYLSVKEINPRFLDADDEIQKLIDMATRINRCYESNPEIAGREKVITSHLDDQNRALLCRLQEVDHSVYSGIDPLHLPEVLSLIGRRHGRGELYAAVSSSIMTLFSTVNRKKCIQQQREYHAAIIVEHRAKVEELDAELAAIESLEGNEGNEEIEHHSNKRRRK